MTGQEATSTEVMNMTEREARELSEAVLMVLEESGEAREHVEVRATVSGTALAREVSEGQYIKTGTPLFELVDLSRKRTRV